MSKNTKPKKLTLSQQIAIMKMQLDSSQEYMREQDQRIKLMRMEIDYHKITERRFDQILEGMCMGMREGNLPRRPHA